MANGDSNSVGIATTDYALKTHQLIKLITDLRALGYVPDVVGSWHSALILALSEFNQK